MTRRGEPEAVEAIESSLAEFDLDALSRAIATARTCDEAWDRYEAHLGRRGVWRACYHYFGQPRQGLRTESVFLRQWGWDPEIVDTYLRRGTEAVDPVMAAARGAVGAVDLSRVELPDRAGVDARAHLRDLHGTARGPGLAVPAWGPGLRLGIGCVELSEGCFDAPVSRLGRALLAAAVGLLHARFVVFASRTAPAPPRLSRRERDVLDWLAQGKSGADIAAILGLSRHTVDTLTRRLFDKLGVTGRTSAVIAALEAGLLPVAGRVEGPDGGGRDA